jgi:hypothetical protein
MAIAIGTFNRIKTNKTININKVNMGTPYLIRGIFYLSAP